MQGHYTSRSLYFCSSDDEHGVRHNANCKNLRNANKLFLDKHFYESLTKQPLHDANEVFSNRGDMAVFSAH